MITPRVSYFWLTIGYPAEAPEKGRKGLGEITFANKYGLHLFEYLTRKERIELCCKLILNTLRAGSRYPHVYFYGQDTDIPAAGFIRRLPECASFMGLPFKVFFQNSKVLAATTGIQNEGQSKIPDGEFSQYS